MFIRVLVVYGYIDYGAATERHSYTHWHDARTLAAQVCEHRCPIDVV